MMTTVKKVEEKPASVPATGLSLDEIKQLITLVDESGLAEVELEVGSIKLKLTSRHGIAAPQQVGLAPAQTIQIAPAAAHASNVNSSGEVRKPVEDDSAYKKVTSPMVGTFYRSPSPTAPVFAKVGDHVTEDSVLCIIEAMKLMNEIKAEASGKIVKIYVENGQPVEYGQPIFAIEPN
ncbi:MAG: acetyl-CoA carboxylase biotin carboxyl carrier protein [Sumerlaeia bacterium]